ncbi:unnamed protein product [Polarella glacialis]|uniref:Pentatricopeptide repeat-containing protein, chloroplastic n=1 Tax=Polarella glacialis TaxID=89957 RepID=A0A813LS90_POLGL|nr:unnamed protein product [Polarella glacialis]
MRQAVDSRSAPEVAARNIGISAKSRVQAWQQAAMLQQEMRVDGLEPDMVTLGAAASACRSMDQWNRALLLLKDARQMTLRLNEQAMGVVVSAFDRGQRWQHAVALLQTTASYGLCANLVACSAAASGCEKGKAWIMALELLRWARGQKLHPEVLTHNTVASSCEKAWRWDKVILCLQDLRQRGLQPDVVSFTAATTACGAAERWDDVLQLLAELQFAGIRGDTILFNSAITACEGCQWVASLHLLAKMGVNHLTSDVVSLNAGASALEKGSQWCRVVDLMLDFAKQRRVRPDSITYSASMAACNRAGNWSLALWLFTRMLQLALRPSTITCEAALRACEMGMNSHPVPGLLQLSRQCVDGTLPRPAVSSPRVALGRRSSMPGVGSAVASLTPRGHRAGGARLAIAGSELLHHHGVLWADIAAGLARAFWGPAELQLCRLLEDSASVNNNNNNNYRKGNLRIQGHLEIPGLGCGTWQTLCSLRLATWAFEDCWHSLARHSIRRDMFALKAAALSSGNAPAMSGLGVWHGAVSSNCRFQHCRGAASGFNEDESLCFPRADSLLRPVHVEHDRSPHAERTALVRLLGNILEAWSEVMMLKKSSAYQS